MKAKTLRWKAHLLPVCGYRQRREEDYRGKPISLFISPLFSTADAREDGYLRTHSRNEHRTLAMDHEDGQQHTDRTLVATTSQRGHRCINSFIYMSARGLRLPHVN